MDRIIPIEWPGICIPSMEGEGVPFLMHHVNPFNLESCCDVSERGTPLAAEQIKQLFHQLSNHRITRYS